MTTDIAEQNEWPERFQASTQSNGFTAIYTDQNHESMADETLIATLYDDRWENLFLTAPELLAALETLLYSETVDRRDYEHAETIVAKARRQR